MITKVRMMRSKTTWGGQTVMDRGGSIKLHVIELLGGIRLKWSMGIALGEHKGWGK